ncbi:MAG: zinc-ribbon domain-containing protein, partial [Ruminococcus sp.]|nr:zinc-ribbon domain-containing protein [Ruminococcus sp.]
EEQHKPKFCPECGAKVERTGAKFCMECGFKLV